MKTLVIPLHIAYIWILLALVGVHPGECKPPNIVFIVADDYGWNDIGYHGSEIHTPTLDKLAAGGVKLENYYVQPICSPSRSQLLSGKYQIHTGLQHSIIWADQPNGLPLELPTLADMLRKQGYATHAVGKWHIGYYKKEFTPVYRGFDSYFGYLTGSEDYFTHMRCDNFGGKKCCGYDLHANNQSASKSYQGQYSAQLFSQHAQGVVREHAHSASDKPLFLYVPFQSVHAPMQVPERYTKAYSHIKNKYRRIYAGMVSALDEAVANITDTLRETGLWDNTLLVFTTDNGGQVHCGGNNAPLRGWKGSLWEGGLHGVGFVHGRMLKETGASNAELMHISDWFPTLVTLAGGDVSGMKLDGHDVWDSISTGAASPRKELLHNIDPLYKRHGVPLAHSPFDVTTRAAIRVGNYKLITGDPGDGHWVPPPAVSSGLPALTPVSSDPNDPRLWQTHVSGSQNVWLFDVVTDPTEHHDLSTSHPDIVTSMLQRLSAYNSTAVPCRFPKHDLRANPELHGGVWGPWED